MSQDTMPSPPPPPATVSQSSPVPLRLPCSVHAGAAGAMMTLEVQSKTPTYQGFKIEFEGYVPSSILILRVFPTHNAYLGFPVSHVLYFDAAPFTRASERHVCRVLVGLISPAFSAVSRAFSAFSLLSLN